MALSYFAESEAPRDFRISSTESDGHYKKCLLCYTVKKNFYCNECIRAGNFVHSSMPYSDRYAEKQAKLLRQKANRRHVLDRCEKLLAPKIKKDSLLTEAKQARDKIDLLRLAIEQRKNNVDEKKTELADLTQQNNDVRLKLPRYQKTVATVRNQAQAQRIELQSITSQYHDKAQSLAALRRSRIRQLTKYIFPVYMTYDSSDSIEDLEFLCEDESSGPRRAHLHVGAPLVRADGDFSDLQAYQPSKEVGVTSPPSAGARAAAALALSAQLVAQLAATLDVRLPTQLCLSEVSDGRCTGTALTVRARRVAVCAGAVCARAHLPPPRAPLAAVHSVAMAAAEDSPMLGRVCVCVSEGVSAAWETAAGVWGWAAEPDDTEPEHLSWPDALSPEEAAAAAGAGSPAPSASLMTSLASMWRGWTH